MSLSKNIIKYQDVYLTIIFGVMIAYGTLFPLEKLPPVPGSDKWKHFLAFGVFVFPVCVRCGYEKHRLVTYCRRRGKFINELFIAILYSPILTM